MRKFLTNLIIGTVLIILGFALLYFGFFRSYWAFLDGEIESFRYQSRVLLMPWFVFVGIASILFQPDLNVYVRPWREQNRRGKLFIVLPALLGTIATGCLFVWINIQENQNNIYFESLPPAILNTEDDILLEQIKTELRERGLSEGRIDKETEAILRNMRPLPNDLHDDFLESYIQALENY